MAHDPADAAAKGAAGLPQLLPDHLFPDHLPHLHRARNVNDLADEKLTTGQKIADAVANTVGSWRFIIVQSVILFGWIVLNVTAVVRHWDPYPFILLNLALSFQAAYSAPFIMMSQNRQSAKDRLHADEDYHVNVQAEHEVVLIHKRLEHLTVERWDALCAMQEEQLVLLRQLRDSFVRPEQSVQSPPPLVE